MTFKDRTQDRYLGIDMGGRFMRIQKLSLRNYRLFKDLELRFSDEESGDANVIVFIGNNGAGKTTLL